MSDYEPKCKKTLPIIFDDRMPVNNLTPKLVGRVNDNTEDLKNLYEETVTMQGDIDSLQDDVDGKLDIPETAGTSGQVLTSDGEGGAIWASVGAGEIVVDPTLTVEGAAADAKKTGDEITHLKQDNSELKSQINIVYNLAVFRVELSSLNIQVPYIVNSGDVVTVRSKDGSIITVGQIRFVRENGTTDYWSISGLTEREITMTEGFVKVYLTSGTAQNIIVEKTGSYLDYDARIEAVDDKAEKNSDDIEKINENITGSDASVVRNGFAVTYTQYINSSGAFVDVTSGWERSDYIEVAPGYSIEASLKGYNVNPIVAYFDSNKNYLSSSSIISDSQNIVNVNAIVPAGVKYAIFVTQTDYSGAYCKAQSVATIAEAVKSINSAISTNQTQQIEGFSLDSSYTGHVANDGTIVTDSSGWIRSEMIEVVEGAPCIASLKGYSSLPIIAFYNSSKQFISASSILSNSQLVVNVNINVPAGAKYVVFVSQSNYDGAYFSVGIKSGVGKAVDQLSDDVFAYRGINIACFGDSLTAGRDGNGNILLKNYPYYMKQTRMHGCNITNYGLVGSTTKSYWDEHKTDITVDSTTDIVLCMWGTNGGLVDTGALATDVEPYDDYEDYADTGVGCYCKIIEYIMELTQNKAQIILITPPYNGDASINSRVINAQAVVKQIAERYGIPCIDMFKSGISKWNYSTYMPVDSVHFSELGYKWIGTYIGSCVNSVCAKLKV